MSNHITRMSTELEELHTKTEALKSFIDKGNTLNLSDTEWSLLEQQYQAMITYRSILAQRYDIAVAS